MKGWPSTLSSKGQKQEVLGMAHIFILAYHNLIKPMESQRRYTNLIQAKISELEGQKF